MPRGKGRGGGGHKGQRRHFTNPDELAAEKEKELRERKWREQRGELSSSEEEEKEEEEKTSSSSEEEESDDDKNEAKSKGISHLIEVQNPNRVVKKVKKVAQIDVEEEGGDAAPELSRKEREGIERQKARAHYLKMHAAGKTDEAKADLARLAMIRKQRDEAAKKRDDERKARDDAVAAKAEARGKALGKKS